MSRIVFHYQVQSTPDQIEDRVESLLMEQTVELSRSVVTDPWVQDHIIGEVVSIKGNDNEGFFVAIAQPLETTGLEAAQFLNVAFGNSSLQPDVALMSVDPPKEFFAAFPGPRFGIDGIRKQLAVPDRALTCTALKPMGLTPEKMADLAYQFAISGLDMIKDDHGLADQAFCPFEKRVELCQRAVEKANQETGRHAIYIPNLIGGPDRVYQYLTFAKQAGVGAVMVEPMLIGPSFLHELASGKAGIPILAHPAFGGIGRIAPEALFGQIFKWFGADGIIYPHMGGRFSYSRETCLGLAREMRSSAHGLRPVFPVPAGGIKTSRIREILEFYGNETILLVGGSLMENGEIIKNSRALVSEVESVARELSR